MFRKIRNYYFIVEKAKQFYADGSDAGIKRRYAYMAGLSPREEALLRSELARLHKAANGSGKSLPKQEPYNFKKDHKS